MCALASWRRACLGFDALDSDQRESVAVGAAQVPLRRLLGFLSHVDDGGHQRLRVAPPNDRAPAHRPHSPHALCPLRRVRGFVQQAPLPIRPSQTILDTRTSSRTLQA